MNRYYRTGRFIYKHHFKFSVLYIVNDVVRFDVVDNGKWRGDVILEYDRKTGLWSISSGAVSGYYTDDIVSVRVALCEVIELSDAYAYYREACDDNECSYFQRLFKSHSHKRKERYKRAYYRNKHKKTKC